jgi:hypothetical protein
VKNHPFSLAMEEAKMAADQVVELNQKGVEGQTESGTIRKEPVSCRVVVITVRSKSGFKGLIAPPPLKDVRSENHYLVGDKKTLEDAFRKVEEGDILVVNAHANEDYFIYGKSKNPVYWTGDAENPGAWDFLGIKKPPKLAALVIASCMKSSDEGAISSARLREIRSAFNTRILVAPKATYQNAQNDQLALDDIIEGIREFYRERIDGADLNERINRKYDRLRVSFGCNGKNHKDGCNCRFGPNWRRAKE